MFYLFLCGPPLWSAMTEDSTSVGIFQSGAATLHAGDDDSGQDFN
jgi:hypothetical protein